MLRITIMGGDYIPDADQRSKPRNIKFLLVVGLVIYRIEQPDLTVYYAKIIAREEIPAVDEITDRIVGMLRSTDDISITFPLIIKLSL